MTTIAAMPNKISTNLNIQEKYVLYSLGNLGTSGTCNIEELFYQILNLPKLHYPAVDNWTWHPPSKETAIVTEALHKYEICGFGNVKKFCEEHGIVKAIKDYIDTVCRIFNNAIQKITLSLTSDPEIEDREKIKLNISIKSDIETVLNLDEKLFKAIDIAVPDRDKDYFVKTYEITE